jgi:hypothetical protein
MSLTVPVYRKDYIGENINYIIDKKTVSQFIEPHENVFAKTNPTSAIVLGNGLTRNYADIKLLLKINSRKLPDGYKLVYACNRAVEDEENYDYYILKQETFMSMAPTNRFSQIYLPNDIFPKYKDKCNLIPYINYFDSGATAAYLACFDGHKKVFLFGFDGDFGTGWRTVYDGRDPYTKENTQANVELSQQYLFNVMETYKNVDFYRVQMDGAEPPASWNSLRNFHNVTKRQAVLAGDF